MRWLIIWIYAVCKPIIITCGSERVKVNDLAAIFQSETTVATQNVALFVKDFQK